MALQLAIAAINWGISCGKNMPCEKDAAIYFCLTTPPDEEAHRRHKKSTGPSSTVGDEVKFVLESGTMAEAGPLAFLYILNLLIHHLTKGAYDGPSLGSGSAGITGGRRRKTRLSR